MAQEDLVGVVSVLPVDGDLPLLEVEAGYADRLLDGPASGWSPLPFPKTAVPRPTAQGESIVTVEATDLACS